MGLTLRIENLTSLPDGGPLSVVIQGKRGLDIGRDQYLDWTLPDPSRFISGKHCEARWHDGGYWLHDISTNGTFLDGADSRLKEPHRLRNGDRFAIGHYIIVAAIDGEGEGSGDGSGAPSARRHVAADIFISYSKQHPQPTRDVAAFLEKEGYSVWWDTNLTSGEIFRQFIDRELEAAKAVIVIWTTHSVASDWVISEAEHAARQKKLIPLRTKDLDTWRVPKPFDTRHTAVVDDREAILKAVRRVVGAKTEAGGRAKKPGAKKAGPVSKPVKRARGLRKPSKAFTKASVKKSESKVEAEKRKRWEDDFKL